MKSNIAQKINTKTGLYVKVDINTGKVVQKKKSTGPFKDIPILTKSAAITKTKPAVKRGRKPKKTTKVVKAIKATKIKPPKKLKRSVIVCSYCNTEKKTTTKQMDKLIQKFGSLELVYQKYHCIKCRKEINVRSDGRAKPTKRKRKEKIDKQKVVHKWLASSAVQCIFRPNDISKAKWSSSIKAAFASCVKKGILHPYIPQT